METQDHYGQSPKINLSKIAEGLNDQSFFYDFEQSKAHLPAVASEFIMKRMMRVE